MSKRHPRPRRSSALLLAALAVVGFRDGSTRGASIVAPLDLGEMALESDAVLLADARRSTAVRRGALIFTNTEFVVRAVVEGTPRPDAIGSDRAIPGAVIPGAILPGAVITVQAPGGELDGNIWHVPGSPRFVSGVRYLLFLRQKDPDPDPDAGGRLWLPLTLSHGLLREAKSPVGSILLTPVDRHPAGSLPRPDGRIPEPVGTYYEVELLEHLGEVVDGRSAWDRRRVEVREEDLPTSGAAAGVPRICSFFENGGRKFRWRAFDSGGSATIRADSRGDLSLPGGGFQQVVQALDTWMSITGTSMNLVFGGPVELDNNCGSRAQGNTIVFNDPCSDIPDVQGCGGVLAFGGPTTSGTHRFDGATWVTISGWIVVVNNGVGCVGADNWRILVAHELGHGLGFGHVADTGALMFSNCCNEPNSTDTTCARFTYPARDPLNRRPTVDAGSSTTVTLARHRLRIAGSASDDARPAVPGDLTTTWRLLGGPGAVSFDDAASPATAVSFSEPGTYVLGLTASDGELLRTDSVQLSVELWAGSVARRTFQQGMGGYRGTVDTFLQENAAARNNARSPELSVDADDPRDSNLASQALLRFDAIFGDRSGQVEPGADVRGAALELSSTNQGDGATLHRMGGPWVDRDTWSRFGGNGVQAGGEALRRADASVAAAGGAVRIDVTPSLRAWSADPASNHGWVFLPRGTNGWDFFSAEGETPPRLTVDFAITEDETLVAAGDVWRYRRGSSAPEADWKELGFRPGAAWVSGPTGIGYGDGDDRTVLQDMRNSYGSIFARREFQVDDPSFLGRLTLRIDYDDGFVAHLNGQEVARSATLGAPGGPVAHTTLASSSREAGSFEEHVADASLLRRGTNVLAVSVHNSSLDSSDFSFIPELVASVVLLDEGAIWKFLRGSQVVPPDWNERDFDDSSWEEGPVGIGYGDGDDETVLGDMEGRYVSVFCRRELDILQPARIEELQLTVIHDDGVAVYLNGEEIGRANLPAGALGRSTRAASSGESRVSSFRIPGEALLPGRNVLAASVHNSAIDSSDLSFVPVVIPVLRPPDEVPHPFRRGDVTDDGILDLADAVRVLNFLFLGGEASVCEDVADADDNGRVELTDPVRVLNYLFLGDAPPPAPGTECGEDPTPDDLEECSSLSCVGG